jgi:hypothetical protein
MKKKHHDLLGIEHGRRHPLAKDKFGEGNRQKWTVIFLACMFIVMITQVYAHIDVVPYLQFLTILCGVMLAGLSGSDMMKAYKVESVNQTIETDQNITENENQNINETENITNTEIRIDPKDVDDGSID